MVARLDCPRTCRRSGRKGARDQHARRQQGALGSDAPVPGRRDRGGAGGRRRDRDGGRAGLDPGRDAGHGHRRRRPAPARPDGHVLPLRRVATLEPVAGQPQMTRENLQQMVAITGRITGRDLGSVMVDVQSVLGQPGVLPPGITYELGGLYQQQQIAFRGLMIVFTAAALLVFLLLLFLYESFRLALSVLVTALLAVSAVFIGLWLTKIPLNISAIMGMTMIIGIVTEVAIFYFSEQQELGESVSWRESLIAAGVNRMRPIAMTTLAEILTLLPLAFAIGQGSQMQQPLAIAIISGLTVQLPLVLCVMPVLFDLAHRRADSASREPT